MPKKRWLPKSVQNNSEVKKAFGTKQTKQKLIVECESRNFKKKFTPIEPWRCPTCGREFRPRIPKQITCSGKCYAEFHSKIFCFECNKELEGEARHRHFCNDECVQSYMDKLRAERDKLESEFERGFS